MRSKTDPLKALEARVHALEEREEARILGTARVLYDHSTKLINLMDEFHDTIEKMDSDLVEKGLMVGATSATQKAYAEWLEAPDPPKDLANGPDQGEQEARERTSTAPGA